MRLTDADLAEFQRIWKGEFKEDISADRARHEVNLLIELYTMAPVRINSIEHVPQKSRVLG